MANITVTPQGNIYLCITKLENDYKNELTFSNATTQLAYFSSVVQHTYSNYTYVKKDNYIQVSDNIDNIINCNYLYYRNVGFTTKYYLCFIKRMEYVNENCTRIYFETDVFQTWQFQIVYNRSFIEREHVNDDTIGLHTIPENLETGEYINSDSTILYDASTTYICVGVTEVVDDILNALSINPRIILYNGIYSGIKYLLCDSALAASNLIRAYDGLGKGDGIYTIFLIPQNFLGTVTFTTVNITIDSTHTITTSLSAITSTNSAYLLNTSSSFTPPSSIDSYTPKNNKLKVFPYSYFYVTNNIGNDVIYHYEDFVSNTASFKTYGSICQGCSIKSIPLNYKKLADSQNSLNSFNYGVVGAKLPVCSWVTDPYTNWLTQNGVNIAGTTFNAQDVSMASSIGSMLLGTTLLTTGVGGMAGGGLLLGGAAGVFNSMQTNYQHDMIPQQAKGSIASGDVQYSTSSTKIQLYKVTIKQEMARAIDDYFSMFGYKVNRLKQPNITGRTNWNYVKTINCNFDGDIPQEDLQVIKKIFDNGITLWHNPSTMLDYSNSNNILS